MPSQTRKENMVICSFIYTVRNYMYNNYFKKIFYYKTKDMKVNFVQIFLYIFSYDESQMVMDSTIK